MARNKFMFDEKLAQMMIETGHDGIIRNLTNAKGDEVIAAKVRSQMEEIVRSEMNINPQTTDAFRNNNAIVWMSIYASALGLSNALDSAVTSLFSEMGLDLSKVSESFYKNDGSYAEMIKGAKISASDVSPEVMSSIIASGANQFNSAMESSVAKVNIGPKVIEHIIGTWSTRNGYAVDRIAVRNEAKNHLDELVRMREEDMKGYGHIGRI